MFLSREIDIKLCKMYTKIHIHAILYKKVSKTDHIPKIRNQSEDYDIPQKLENLRFAPFIIFNFQFAFLIGIIDNIISFSPYSLYNVTRISANGSAVYWSRDIRLYYVTSTSKQKRCIFKMYMPWAVRG